MAFGDGQSIFGSLHVGDKSALGQLISDNQFVKPIGDRLLFGDGKLISSTVSPDGKHVAALSTEAQTGPLGGDPSVSLVIFNLQNYSIQQTIGDMASADLKIDSQDVGQEGPTYSPDGKFLWMPRAVGYDRFPVNADGSLGAPTLINLVQGSQYGDPRIEQDPDLGQTVATFDGVDDSYAYTLDGSKLANGFTLECKVRFDKTVSVTQEACDNTNGAGTQMLLTGGRLRFTAYINGAYQYVYYTPPDLAVGKWYDLTGTWDGSTMKLYVDGQLVGQTAAAGAFKPSTGGAAILAISGEAVTSGVTQFFATSSAADRVYSRPLSAQEVADLYANGSKGSAGPGDVINADFAQGAPVFHTQYPLTAQAVLSPDGSTLYAVLNGWNQVAAIDPSTGHVEHTWNTGAAPRDMVMVGHKLYVSNEGGRPAKDDDTTIASYGTPIVSNPQTGASTTGTVSVIDTSAPDQPVGQINVGLHPTALYEKDNTLFAANTGSDTVSIIDTSSDEVMQTITTQPWSGTKVGYEPDGITLTDSGRLLVTLGRANAVAVYKYDSSKHPASYIGLLPTDYFPENVATDGNDILVTNLRGIDDEGNHPGSINEGDGSTPATGTVTGPNAHNSTGTLQRFQLPSDAVIKQDTSTVFAQNNWTGGDVQEATNSKAKPVAIPARIGDPSTIKYVYLVIKENRSYDQVLGDDQRGNGDPSLTQFGEAATPNQHAMANQFGLYDNFYDMSTNSSEGHTWLLESDNPEYMESQSGQYVRTYGPADPLSGQRSGYIWSDAEAAGKTVRNFGENPIANTEAPDTTWQGMYCDAQNMAATGEDSKYPQEAAYNIPSLDKVSDHAYGGGNLNVPDQWRYEMWKKDFDQNGPANLNIVRLGDDHTGGAPVKPVAQVADNDLALGKIVDTVSHSKYWKQTAIFVVEDDTQTGIDHVDGMRGPVQVISPWALHGQTDSHYYTQINMIRAIEQILGMQPMNEHDAAASPMPGAFTNKPDYTPFNAVKNQIPLTYGLTTPPPCGYDTVSAQDAAKASAEYPIATTSSTSNLAKAWQNWASKQSFAQKGGQLDSAPPALMNRYTWYEDNGWSKPYPGDTKVYMPNQVPGAYLYPADTDQ